MASRNARGQIELARAFRALLAADAQERAGWARNERASARIARARRSVARTASARRFDSWRVRQDPLRSWLWSSVFDAVRAARGNRRRASWAARNLPRGEREDEREARPERAA